MLPEEYLKNMQQILSETEYKQYLSCFNEKPQKCIRVNTQKITVEKLKDLANFNLEEIPYCKTAFYVDADQKLGKNPLHFAGAFYIQEPSSLIPVLSISHLNFEGKKALDLCASPGGKTGQLSELVGENGVVVSNEIVYSRTKILQENVERLGYKNVVVTCDKPENFAREFEKSFDIVLVDAPCSGEGMFRKDENASKQWSSIGIVSNAKRQLEILKNGAKAVKSGGYLIYSTCTFNPTENEQVVLNLLNENENFESVELNPDVKPFLKSGLLGLDNAGRFYPFYAKGEGQFVAVLRKKNGQNYNKFEFVKELSSSVSKSFVLSTLKTKNEFKLEQIGNYVNIIPNNLIDTKKINVIVKGVKLGEIVKMRLEPAHQFFSAFGTEFNNQLHLNLFDERVLKYLHGEEIFDSTIENGYGVVLIENCAVGGFKAVDGVLKNKFPKSLRLQN